MFEEIEKLMSHAYDIALKNNKKPLVKPLRKIFIGFEGQVRNKLERIAKSTKIPNIEKPKKYVYCMVICK